MKKLNLKIKDMPYAAEEALNRLRVNIKIFKSDTIFRRGRKIFVKRRHKL
jgi:hypothetical protein